ncbi:hypothetical protein ES703_112433 [subsurface metagenome]
MFCVCVAHVPVNVPEVVTGLPVTVISEGKLNPTDVTVPGCAPDATPSSFVLSVELINPWTPVVATE